MAGAQEIKIEIERALREKIDDLTLLAYDLESKRSWLNLRLKRQDRLVRNLQFALFIASSLAILGWATYIAGGM